MEDIDFNGYWMQVLQYWDRVVQDWNAITHSCDQATHWLMNDGSSFSTFVLFVLACWLVIFFTARGHKKQISQSRAGYDIDDFVCEMSAAGYDAAVARTVYQYIEEIHRIDFPILPGDDLCTLGITDDGVQRGMPMLMEATGREPRMGRLMKQLTTVEDLVRYLENLPRATDYVWELQTA